MADQFGESWASPVDVNLHLSSAQPGHTGARWVVLLCTPLQLALTPRLRCAAFSLSQQGEWHDAYEVDVPAGAALPDGASASCELPGGGRRALLRGADATPAFAVSRAGGVYGVTVVASQGATVASATAEARAAEQLVAPGIVLRLTPASALVAHGAAARLSDSWLLVSNSSDAGFMVERALFGAGANQVGVQPVGWAACAPCASPLGACTAVPADGFRGIDQLAAFRSATLASSLGSACTQLQSSTADRRIHCQGDGDMRVDVTLSLTRFAMTRVASAAPAPPPSESPALPPRPPASSRCGSGSCARAASSAVNCTCGAHGTLHSSGGTAGACGCVCEDGWATDPNQDLFAPVYCDVMQTTLDAMGNPDVAPGAVPATALAASGGNKALLTPSGWALVVGVFVGLTCVCICCYRRAAAAREWCALRAESDSSLQIRPLQDLLPAHRERPGIHLFALVRWL